MEWGTVANWVTAVITAAGFAAAVLQLRINLGDSRSSREQALMDREAEREAMSRAVGVKALWQPNERGGPPEGHDGLMPVDVEVLNSGPYPIYAAVLHLASDEEDHPMEVVYGTILPGEHLKNTYGVRRSEVMFGELTGGVTLVLSDTYDNHWSSSTSWRGLERRDLAARIC